MGAYHLNQRIRPRNPHPLGVITSQLQLFPAAQPSQQEVCAVQEHPFPERQPQSAPGSHLQFLHWQPVVPAKAGRPINKNALKSNIENIFIKFL